MRIYTIILTILTVVLVSYGIWLCIEDNQQPSVIVDGGELYNAGKVSPTKPIVHIFRLENPNAFTVGIAAPVAGCTCTTATVSAGTIPAHGAISATLRVAPEDGAFTGSAEIITSHAGKSVDTWLFVSGNS
jgi:hypothetical protein